MSVSIFKGVSSVFNTGAIVSVEVRKGKESPKPSIKKANPAKTKTTTIPSYNTPKKSPVETRRELLYRGLASLNSQLDSIAGSMRKNGNPTEQLADIISNLVHQISTGSTPDDRVERYTFNKFKAVYEKINQLKLEIKRLEYGEKLKIFFKDNKRLFATYFTPTGFGFNGALVRFLSTSPEINNLFFDGKGETENRHKVLEYIRRLHRAFGIKQMNIQSFLRFLGASKEEVEGDWKDTRIAETRKRIFASEHIGALSLSGRVFTLKSKSQY